MVKWSGSWLSDFLQVVEMMVEGYGVYLIDGLSRIDRLLAHANDVNVL
jgi:hypothetical protein